MLPLKSAVGSLAITALLVPSPVRAQSAPSPSQTDHQAHAAQQNDQAAPAHSMMKMHEQMMADMKALDAKIDAIVASMNTGQGDARIDAMVELLNTLVEKQKAMHECMTMHGEMAQLTGPVGKFTQTPGNFRGGLRSAAVVTAP